MNPKKRVAVLLSLSLLLAGICIGQPLAPDFANVRYGPDERNVLDLWVAKSDQPTPLLIHIHGGGFVGGDKTSVGAALVRMCLERKISVAAINYRFVIKIPFPAPMLDGARAVQFLRSRAKEWNLDPTRFAATGGSAGAGMSLWIAFHDDLANPQSDDPVKRHSTRLSSVGVVGAQTTYDPRVIARIAGPAAARHPSLEYFYGMKGPELTTERAYAAFADASPSTHLTAGDPPAFLFYSDPDEPVPANAKPGTGIHHPAFGRYLKERMDKLGIECVLRHRTDYTGDVQRQMYAQMLDFFETNWRARNQLR